MPDRSDRWTPRAVLWLLPAGLAVLSGLRAFGLVTAYAAGVGATERHHVESAVVAFVVFAALARLAGRPAAEASLAAPVRLPGWMAAGFIAGAGLLYAGALGVGLLSDDFELVRHAAGWNLSPVTSSLFRPVPLLIWSALLQIGGGATALHLLNVLLHGTNAWLTSLVLQGWGLARAWSVIGGLLVLAHPLAVEPVAWSSGVFDLLATACILSAVLLGARYQDSADVRPLHRVGLFAASIGALLSKETAVVVPLLVWLGARARGALPRALTRDLAVLLGLAVLYGTVRALWTVGPVAPPLERYVLQRALFSTFGSLGMPFHADLVHQSEWMPILTALVVLAVILAFALSAGSARAVRSAWIGVVWVLVAMAPVYPLMPIAPDLQGSRYLYLASVGWSAAIVSMAASMGGTRPVLARIARAGIVALVVIGSIATVVHLDRWREAGVLRDRIIESAARDERMQTCRRVALEGLPDNVRGAYLFRNGAEEAFEEDAGLTLSAQPEPVTCVFRWNAAAGGFERAGGEALRALSAPDPSGRVRASYR